MFHKICNFSIYDKNPLFNFFYIQYVIFQMLKSHPFEYLQYLYTI